MVSLDGSTLALAAAGDAVARAEKVAHRIDVPVKADGRANVHEDAASGGDVEPARVRLEGAPTAVGNLGPLMRWQRGKGRPAVQPRDER